jgi:hypothetical protein
MSRAEAPTTSRAADPDLSRPEAPDPGDLTLLAIRLGPSRMTIRPAARDRPWMQTDGGRYAKRCLPLMIANQAGWELLNPATFHAVWDGDEGLDAVRVWAEPPVAPPPALSHFGCGILTWALPYLFRTPPGWNLLARGPANRPKDGIAALEGLVETDWACSPFTMNWKFTRPGHVVTFGRDEPFALIVPTRRRELERFQPEMRDADAEPEAYAGFRRWAESRAGFIRDLGVPGSVAEYEGWQRHYMLGVDVDGTKAPAHETKLRVHHFPT